MIRNIMKQGSLTLAILTGLSLSSMPLMSHATNISLDKMTSDITYLASDKLNGRANFSAASAQREGGEGRGTEARIYAHTHTHTLSLHTQIVDCM